MKNLFYQENASKYLYLIILSIILLTYVNSLLNVLNYEFGSKHCSFLFGPNDRFADIIKVALSFKAVTGDIAKSDAFQAWPDIYKNYFLNNPYRGIEGLAQGSLTHFHLPPLSVLIFCLAGKLIAVTMRPTLVLVFFGTLYLLLVLYLYQNYIRPINKNNILLLAILFITVFSYPALFMLTRGNFNAGFTSLLIILFLVALYTRKLNLVALLALAIAANIRPNALVFIIAMPLVTGFKKSIIPIMTVLFMFFFIFTVSIIIDHNLYEYYTFSNFLSGLNIYNQMYIRGDGGDAFNSSLFSLVKNANVILHINLPYQYVWAVGNVMMVLIASLIGYIIYVHKQDSLALVMLTYAYILISPVFADYHLLVLLAPIAILYLGYTDWKYNLRMFNIIAVSSVLVLSPKNYVYFGSIPLQSILNPFILCISLAIIGHETYASGNTFCQNQFNSLDRPRLSGSGKL
jgi:hypothetical protein